MDFSKKTAILTRRLPENGQKILRRSAERQSRWEQKGIGRGSVLRKNRKIVSFELLQEGVLGRAEASGNVRTLKR